MATLLSWTLVADPLDSGVLVTQPTAGVPYTLDCVWGPGPADRPGRVSVILVPQGLTPDYSYGQSYTGHRAAAPAGSRLIDLGWSPDARPAYLNVAHGEVAAGFWRLTFPAPGTYQVALTPVGSFSIACVGQAAAPTTPAWQLLEAAPMGAAPAKLGQLSFTGDYPAGGFDVDERLLGVGGLLFIDIPPQPPYQWAWSANKLHMYDQNGEIGNGTHVSWSATALVIGAGN